MHETSIERERIQQAARQRSGEAMPLDQLDPSDTALFEADTVGTCSGGCAAKPVHRSHSPLFGPYWSVTRYQDIMAVDTNHRVFSSAADLGGITLEVPGDARREISSPWTRRARRPAQDREPDRRAGQPGNMEGADPRAHPQGARRPAAQRDLRLGRPRCPSN